MDESIEINRRNWDERAILHGRDDTGGYGLDRFRAGEDCLLAIESAELGDISGKRVLHLQCHIGRDTLCLVRRGAVVTGLDFSGPALDFARRLAEETGLKANFVQGTVDEAPHLTPGPYDLVFATWGTLCWLPDMTEWARVVASVLAPGGELYCADSHPSFMTLEEQAGKLVPTHDFQTPPDQPLEFIEETTYTGDRTVLKNQAMRVWIHSISTILGALIDAVILGDIVRQRLGPGVGRQAAEVILRQRRIGIQGDGGAGEDRLRAGVRAAVPGPDHVGGIASRT